MVYLGLWRWPGAKPAIERRAGFPQAGQVATPNPDHRFSETRELVPHGGSLLLKDLESYEDPASRGGVFACPPRNLARPQDLHRNPIRRP